MVKTLKDVKALAKTLGAKVEDDKSGNCHTCRVEAPHGKVWACDDIHELVDETNRPWTPDYDDVLSRMNYGLNDCPHGDDCEWCYPEEE